MQVKSKSNCDQHLIACRAGAPGTGKTALALGIAQELGTKVRHPVQHPQLLTPGATARSCRAAV